MAIPLIGLEGSMLPRSIVRKGLIGGLINKTCRKIHGR